MPEIEGIKYDNDGKYSVNNLVDDSLYTKISDSDDFIYSKNKITYIFNRRFRLDHITDFSDGDIPYETEEGKIKQDLRHMLQPVLDTQTKPLVNFQWLFNILFQDRLD